MLNSVKVVHKIERRSPTPQFQQDFQADKLTMKMNHSLPLC